MAVCKMWVVRGRLDHPLDYISNSEKTTREELIGNQFQSLRDVMDYTSNGEKTYDTDEERYLSSINCCLQTARQDMIITKRQWCDESPIIAFHGFQSFKHGEVTPDLAHEIGIRLAEKIWGERFEVVISTHLNTDCIHNHFVVNSTALDGGNRHHGNKASIKRMRNLSDELCKEYGLSVIENPSKFKNNAYLSRLELSGMPTQNVVALKCIEEAIQHSFTKDDFFKQMNSMGYKCDFRESRKYATITPYGRTKPIRTQTIHKDYSKEYIYARIRENTISVRKTPIEPPLKKVGYRNVTAYSIYIAKQKGGLKGLYLHYCYLLGILPKNTQRNNVRLHYLLKEDLMKMDKISEQTRLLHKYKIGTMQELLSFKDNLNNESLNLIEQRKKLWSKSRSITDPEQMVNIKEQINKCSTRLKEIRKEVKHCDEIADRAPVINEKIAVVEKETQEKLNRKEQTKDESFRRRS